MPGKDEALLHGENSSLRTDSITERIARLKREIGRGAEAYSPDELKKLEAMLAEYESLLYSLTHQ